MTDCTERSEGREGMPGRHGMSERGRARPASTVWAVRVPPVAGGQNGINSVKRLTVEQETV
ncbi:hypothetical protein KRM28CT15_06440 [Krasilnikovia sp. M28-CT-15]